MGSLSSPHRHAGPDPASRFFSRVAEGSWTPDRVRGDVRGVGGAALLALALIATPLAAQDDLSPRQAEERLRGCLITGAGAAPRTSLREAVAGTRAFCLPQIRRVQRDRVALATAGLEGDAASEAEKRTIRALNNEIALAIANFTGLTVEGL